MSSNRTWRILAAITFPQATVATSPPGHGSILPQSISLITRIPKNDVQVVVSGASVSLGPWRGPQLPLESLGMPSELARLTLITNGDSPETGLMLVEDLLEQILDDLSFQLQEAVHVLQLEVLDITPPLSVGMVREILLYPFPIGYSSPKFLKSVTLGDSQTRLIPNLRSDYSVESEKTRAALRWYVKGLSTPFVADKFAFFWISIEILCAQSDIVVERPYTARCGHEIPSCPVCNKPTAKVVNGSTIKKFLIEKTGIASETARDLWRMRQMFHGTNYLSQHATSDLTPLVLKLRHATLQALKQALAISPEQLPTSSAEGTSLDQTVALGGTREISEYDLAP